MRWAGCLEVQLRFSRILASVAFLFEVYCLTEEIRYKEEQNWEHEDSLL